MTSEELLHLVWLNIATDGDAELAEKLVSHFGTPEDVYCAPLTECYKVKHIEDKNIDRLEDKSLEEAKKCIEFCEKYGIRLLTNDSKGYPERLNFIRYQPMLLYAMGKDVNIDDNVCIAVVGTRHCSDYGRMNARKISYELAAQGAVVVSGIASGIDAAAHRACIEAGGQTIAVLGCGIKTAYPKENRELYKEVIENGMILTEYPPDSRPEGSHFPVRNRIISGLSLGTVVIEADPRSGALITARRAAEQGKQTYAIPAKLGDYSCAGNLEIIKNGAKLITCGADVLEDFELSYPHRVKINRKLTVPPLVDSTRELPVKETKERSAKTEENEKVKNKPENKNFDITAVAGYDNMSPAGKQIVSLLAKKRMTADEIVSFGIGIDDVLIELTMMEISGAVSACVGGYYELNTERE